VIYNNNFLVEFFAIITCKYVAFSRFIFHTHSSFMLKKIEGFVE
jgi:hypothetical protein